MMSMFGEIREAMEHDGYISPFSERYGTKDMRTLFSDNYRWMMWRELWYTLARAQRLLGANITESQLLEIGAAISSKYINYDKVRQYEDETHHDVVAHLMEFSDHCPTAKGILHLGATSCYVTDNADIIIMRKALAEVYKDIKEIVTELCDVAHRSMHVPLVGRTHLQKAQLTTVGKRVCMWIQDLVMDLEMVHETYDKVRLLGCKGATGSQSSLYTLFEGDYDKAKRLDDIISNHFRAKCVEISGQTYTRKIDSMVANVLSQIAQSASKMATDIRLMSAFGEMYEGFGKNQVGSSAMPYKRNPITCEKVCGISRHIICNAQNTAITASTQWLERTLDDSSNKRIVIAELFLGTSEVLKSIKQIINGLVIIDGKCIDNAAEHAKMASLEDDIIKNVMDGGDRLEDHKKAIWSSGSDNADINTGFAEQQAEEYVRYIRRRLRSDL